MAQTTTLNFNVIGQSLERLDDNRIVEKAKNYVEAQFSFNEVWENTTKAILIEGSNLKYKAYLNEENKCLIPNRVVRHDGFTLTVVGEDSEKFITITTNDLFIPISSNRVEDSTPRYVEVIESNTLDVTRNEETYKLEIPSKYRRTYLHELTLTMGFYRYDEETEEETEVECGTIEAYAVVDTDAKITIDNYSDYNKFIVIPHQHIELRTDEDIFDDSIYNGIITIDNEIKFMIVNSGRFEYYTLEYMGVFIMNITDSF